MKRSLMFAAAISAFVVPAAAPLTAVAQDAPLFRSREDIRAARRAETEAARPAAPTPAPTPQRQERREDRQERREDRQEGADRSAPPANENRQERREDRQERREERRDTRQDNTPAPQDRTENRRDRRQDRQESLEERAQRRPDQPLYRNRQDVIDARDAEARGEPWRPRTDRQERREDRRENRQERREDRREYRDFHQRFSGDQWRRDYGRRYNSGWWRSDRRFRGYNGIRVGFYFAPNHGYYQVPRQYWGQRYYEGQYMPSIFWRYSLDDWRTYGLGYPPEGTRWVLVDNHIYLIDEYDGYIIDVIYDAWRW